MLAIEASEEIATRFLSRIERSFEPLRHHPELGPAREHLEPGLRVTFHASFAIYYKGFADAVVIVRVLRGARDVAALAERGGLT
ncbi:MAG: type II toxin-antitoxin system RelE/ParE family toxin [Janthinobacterium lividum]